jgi:ABC-type glycerol-3-phosphate transport system substrate-binding protein
MKLIKSISLVVLLVFIAVATSGCSLFGSKTPATPKVITIWGFDDEDVWKPFFKDISNTLDGYEVVYTKKTLSPSYENDSLNSILSGQGPDVWAIPNDWVYRHKDKLAPMPDSLVKKTEINVEDMFVPAVKNSSVFDGKVYSLSPTVDTLMIYYNPEIFEIVLNEYDDAHRGEENIEARREASRLLDQAPTTWSDIAKASNLITRKGGSSISRSGIALGTANNIARSQDILYALMLQNETAITSSDYKLATFNLPQNTNSGANDYPSRRALDFYTSFSDPNSANYSWNAAMPQDIESFASGQVSMMNPLLIIYPRYTQILNIKNLHCHKLETGMIMSWIMRAMPPLPYLHFQKMSSLRGKLFIVCQQIQHHPTPLRSESPIPKRRKILFLHLRNARKKQILEKVKHKQQKYG